MKTAAVTYARYSSDAQDASSIEDQQRNCRRRADTERWIVVAQFADAAMTGSNNARPQYRTMLAAAERREFDVLLVDDLSRLTRDSVEQERAIRRIEFAGVRLIALSDGYDSLSKSRKIHRQVKGIMNEVFLDDLAERVHRGSMGKALRGFWLGGKPHGYRLRPVLDPSGKLDPYGNPARVGTMLEPDPAQAAVVREIFEAWAVQGLSAITIAAALNARGVPSPGSFWSGRKARRCSGWMQSAVRSILRNPLYTGRQHWNTHQFLKEPETGKDRRRKRPKAEHVEHHHEHLRLVSDELFALAAARFGSLADGDPRLKKGGKPKHLLSGQLKCAACGSNYVLGDKIKYRCAGYAAGRACSNDVWVRRDALEETILRPLDRRLLEPKRLGRMVNWMRTEYARRMAADRRAADAVPRDLAELDARLARLRGGVADLEADELAAAIARVEAKRRALLAATGLGVEGRVFDLLPRAAEAFRAQIAQGLEGDPAAVAAARLVLPGLLGPIRLEPSAGGALWASYGLSFTALLRSSAGTDGRGDRI